MATRTCTVCRGPLPRTARADAKYCSDACRQKAMRQRTADRRPPPPTPIQLATQALLALPPWQRRRAADAANMNEPDTGSPPREVVEMVDGYSVGGYVHGGDRWRRHDEVWVSTLGARVTGQHGAWVVDGLAGVTFRTLNEAERVGSLRAVGWFTRHEPGS